jgi:N utilization substance protein B
VPARAAIKEYVDVAGAFFGPTESGMVNAVLDKIAREERAWEMGACGGSSR